MRAVVVEEDRRDVAVVEVAKSVDHLSGRRLDGPDPHVRSMLAQVATHTHQGARRPESGHEVRDLRNVGEYLGAGMAIVRVGIGGVRVLVEEGPRRSVRTERLGQTNGAVGTFGPG